MEMQEFIEQFAEAIEVEDTAGITSETDFRDLDEWSSISVMLVIAFFDEAFGKSITETDIRKSATIGDLYQLATA